MKFNIIGNPPYNGKGEKLYLKIMSECTKFSDRAVWIIPTDFVDNPRIKENVNYSHIEILDRTFEEFDRIETVVGDAKFDDAAFFSDVGIFVFGEKKRDLLELRWNKFSDPVKYKKITEIVDAYLIGKPTIATESGKENEWYIQLSEIRGHRRCWDWPTIISAKRYIPIKNVPKSALKCKNQYIGFATTEECRNFIDWCNTDLAMFLNFLYKFNQHTKYDCVPVYDFTKPVDEDWAYGEIGLAEYKDFIKDEMKEYGYKCYKAKRCG